MINRITVAFHDPRLASTSGGGETLTLAKIESLPRSMFHPVIITRDGPRSTLFTRFLQRNPHVEVLSVSAPDAGLPNEVEKFIDKHGGRALWGKDTTVDDGIRFNAAAGGIYAGRSFDVVSCSFITDFFGLPSMRRAVLHVYGCPPVELAAAEAPLLGCFDRISAVSSYVRDEFCRLMSGSLNPSAVEILSPALGPAFHGDVEIHDRRTCDFLFAGRLVQRKGVDMILAALSLLRGKRTKPVTAIIVGDGPEREGLKDTCAKLDLGDVVSFSGSMTQDELSALMRRSRCFVYPVRKPEAFGLAPLEAMSQGAVPILGVLGGMAEYAEHRANAFVLGAGFDAVELANVMAEALDDHRRWEAMATNGVQTARRYGWDEFQTRTARFFREVHATAKP